MAPKSTSKVFGLKLSLTTWRLTSDMLLSLNGTHFVRKYHIKIPNEYISEDLTKWSNINASGGKKPFASVTNPSCFCETFLDITRSSILDKNSLPRSVARIE